MQTLWQDIRFGLRLMRWESTRLTTHFDPVPVLQKIKCPALLMFGELDPTILRKKAQTSWRAR
jgi:hypothetical protein